MEAIQTHFLFFPVWFFFLHIPLWPYFLSLISLLHFYSHSARLLSPNKYIYIWTIQQNLITFNAGVFYAQCRRLFLILAMATTVKLRIRVIFTCRFLLPCPRSHSPCQSHCTSRQYLLPIFVLSVLCLLLSVLLLPLLLLYYLSLAPLLLPLLIFTSTPIFHCLILSDVSLSWRPR